MGIIKAYLLGLSTAYVVYFITRKRANGTSILDDLLEDPATVMRSAKDYAVGEAVQAVKNELT